MPAVVTSVIYSLDSNPLNYEELPGPAVRQPVEGADGVGMLKPDVMVPAFMEMHLHCGCRLLARGAWVSRVFLPESDGKELMPFTILRNAMAAGLGGEIPNCPATVGLVDAATRVPTTEHGGIWRVDRFGRFIRTGRGVTQSAPGAG